MGTAGVRTACLSFIGPKPVQLCFIEPLARSFGLDGGHLQHSHRRLAGCLDEPAHLCVLDLSGQRFASIISLPETVAQVRRSILACMMGRNILEIVLARRMSQRVTAPEAYHPSGACHRAPLGGCRPKVAPWPRGEWRDVEGRRPRLSTDFAPSAPFQVFSDEIPDECCASAKHEIALPLVRPSHSPIQVEHAEKSLFQHLYRRKSLQTPLS